jgi:hypothetical protein
MAALLSLLGAFAPALVAPMTSSAAGLADDGGAEWRVEQPPPPPPPAGVSPSNVPVGLGRIGDIEFWDPNRGALITAGNGSSVPAGVWLYNGERWRELASECGASNGRIAWAGPNEFWTVSNGRPGQAVGPNNELPPLEDNTLCRFAPGASGRLEIVASYASLAFQADSYRPMNAAGCVAENDCWFGGGALKPPLIGAFQLHWNGHTLQQEPYFGESHAILDARPFNGRLYASVRLLAEDPVIAHLRHPPTLHVINGEGASEREQGISELPPYAPGEFPDAREYLHLGADEGSLWAASGPATTEVKESKASGIVVDRYTQSGETGSWSTIFGPETTPLTGSEVLQKDEVSAIAPEPETESAWMALDTLANATNEVVHGNINVHARAVVVRVSAGGASNAEALSDEQELPEEPPRGEGYGPIGAATRVVCPAIHDCWLTTTQGWLIHLSTGAPEPLDTDPVFASEELITYRPPDEGVPQALPDAPPEDDSGLEEVAPPPATFTKATTPNTSATVPVPLVSGMHTRLVHGTTLELRFRLAVRARVRLLAERHRKVVAATTRQTLGAGRHRLLLRLDLHDWPTKLNFQTRALAKLPTRSTREPGVETVSTSLVFPDTVGLLGSRPLP